MAMAKRGPIAIRSLAMYNFHAMEKRNGAIANVSRVSS